MKRVSNILNVFASHTSVHGLPNVILSRSVVGLSVWSTICFASVLIFIFQIADILHRYNEYPKKVVVENVVEPIDGLSSAPFPSITVCNMRHLDFRVLNAINRLLSEDENAASHVDSVEDVGRGLQFIRQYMRVIAKYEPLAHRLHGDQKYRNLVTELLSRTTVSANIPEEVVKLASVQRDDLFVTCTLRGNHCNMSTDFVSLFDPYYYNCFTFTAPLTERFAMSTAGAEFGWSSILLSGNGLVEGHEDLFQSILSGMYESRSALSASEGVRVVIHPPDTQPFPLAEGYDVPPGYSASFGVKPRRNERVGQPHGNCRHENPFESEEIYQAVSNVTMNDIEDEKRRDQPPYHRNRQRYRRISCIRLCIQRHVIKSCHCYDSALPVTKTRPSPPSASAPTTVGNGTMAAGKNKLKADVKPCRLNDELSDSCMYNATDDCLEALMALYDRIECARRTRDAVTRNTTVMAQCGCHPPCEEFQYDVSYSLSKWPATGFDGDNAFYDIVHNKNFPGRLTAASSDSQSKAAIREYFSDRRRHETIKDLVKLNVFVADDTVTVTRESADFELSRLISEIGGQLAVWLGLSVIGIFEIAELFVTLLRHVIISRSHHTTRSTYKLSSVVVDDDRTRDVVCSTTSSLHLVGTTRNDSHG